MDQLIPCAIVTGGIFSAYLAREHLRKTALWSTSKLIDLYIDLKWLLDDPSEVTTAEVLAEPVTLCPGSVSASTPYKRYLYRGREYITFGELPSARYLADNYDPDESISTVIVLGSERRHITPDHSLHRTLGQLAGPLCDFHNDTSNIVSYLTNLDARSSLDTSKVIRIIVNTENYKEYILESPATNLEVHLHQDQTPPPPPHPEPAI